MSERNMLKVMMSLLTASLLAITFAATTVHAGRLDKLLSSAEILQVKGSDLIPWTECHETCDKCSCTKMLPVESNWCTCRDEKAAAAVAVQKVNAVLFPRKECHKNCNSGCVCILIWPPPKYCSCFDPIQPKAKCSENCEGVCVCDSPENCSCSTDDIKLSKNPKVKSSGLMSVSECMQSCNGVCGCGLIFPPETNVCHCFDTIKSSKKAVPKMKSGSLIPIDECSEKCNVQCACAAIYPPPDKCFCSDPKSLAM